MDEINDLSRKFLCCSNLRDFHLKRPVLDISWEEQKQFLLKTVLHPLVLKYPLSYPFQRSFLRTVIHGLENAGVEVHDDVYRTYTSLLEASTTEYAYKHFVFSDDVVISLKESSRLISDGSTGLHSWEAALALAEWCLQNTDKLKDKCVVELGSGAGLVGLTVAKCCSPRALWMTDCHPAVLSLLKDNLLLNYSEARQVESEDFRIISQVCTEACASVGVMNAPWEDIPSASVLPWPDVLLAADVVYDASLFPALCSSLSHFLHPPQPPAPPLVLVVCTVRNEDTFQEFIQMLGAYRIHSTEMDTPPPIHFVRRISPDDPPVKILRLTSVSP